MISSEGQTTFSRLFPFLFMLMPFSQILHCSFFLSSLLFIIRFSFIRHTHTHTVHSAHTHLHPTVVLQVERRTFANAHSNASPTVIIMWAVCMPCASDARACLYARAIVLVCGSTQCMYYYMRLCLPVELLMLLCVISWDENIYIYMKPQQVLLTSSIPYYSHFWPSWICSGGRSPKTLIKHSISIVFGCCLRNLSISWINVWVKTT